MSVTVLSLRQGAPLYRQWLRCVPDRFAAVRLERQASMLPAPWPVVALCEAALDGAPHVLVQGVLGESLWLPSAALQRDEVGELWTDVDEGLGTRVELTWHMMKSSEGVASTLWAQVSGDESWVYIRLWDAVRRTAEGPVLRAPCTDVLQKSVVADVVLAHAESVSDPLKLDAVGEHASSFWIIRFLSGFELGPIESHPSSGYSACSPVDGEQAKGGSDHSPLCKSDEEGMQSAARERIPASSESVASSAAGRRDVDHGPRTAATRSEASSESTAVEQSTADVSRIGLTSRVVRETRASERGTLCERSTVPTPRKPIATEKRSAVGDGESSTVRERTVREPEAVTQPTARRVAAHPAVYASRPSEAEVNQPLPPRSAEVVAAGLSATEVSDSAPHLLVSTVRERQPGTEASSLRCEGRAQMALSRSPLEEQPEPARLLGREPARAHAPLHPKERTATREEVSSVSPRAAEADARAIVRGGPLERAGWPQTAFSAASTSRSHAASASPRAADAHDRSRRAAYESVRSEAPSFGGGSSAPVERPTTFRRFKAAALRVGRLDVPRPWQLPTSRHAGPTAAPLRPGEQVVDKANARERGPERSAPTSQHSGRSSISSTATVLPAAAADAARQLSAAPGDSGALDKLTTRAAKQPRAAAAVQNVQTSALSERSPGNVQVPPLASHGTVVPSSTAHAAPASSVIRTELETARDVSGVRAPVSLIRWLAAQESSAQPERSQVMLPRSGTDRARSPLPAAIPIAAARSPMAVSLGGDARLIASSSGSTRDWWQLGWRRSTAAPRTAAARATWSPSYESPQRSHVARPRIARTIEIGEILVDLSWEPRAASAPDSNFVTAGTLVDSIPWSRSLVGGYR